eukprot:1173227-Pyramimonas_sp.AAC.1
MPPAGPALPPDRMVARWSRSTWWRPPAALTPRARCCSRSWASISWRRRPRVSSAATGTAHRESSRDGAGPIASRVSWRTRGRPLAGLEEAPGSTSS